MTTTNYKTDGQVAQKSLSLIRVKVDDAARTSNHPRGFIITDYHPRGFIITDYHQRSSIISDYHPRG